MMKTARGESRPNDGNLHLWFSQTPRCGISPHVLLFNGPFECCFPFLRSVGPGKQESDRANREWVQIVGLHANGGELDLFRGTSKSRRQCVVTTGRVR